MHKKNNTDEFTLYDLKIETVRCEKDKQMVCNHPVGSYFIVSGENVSIPNNSTFPLYPLAAIVPLLPAKQRETHENDWITTDSEVACPDPNCGGVFQIRRIGTQVFKHSEVTITSLERIHE